MIHDALPDEEPFSSVAASILILFFAGPPLFLIYVWLTSTDDEWDLELLYFLLIIVGGFLLLLCACWCITFFLFLENKTQAKKSGTYVKKPKELVYWSRYHGYIERPEKPKKVKDSPNIMAGKRVSIRVPGTRSTTIMPSPQSMSSPKSMNLDTKGIDLANGRPYHLTVSENFISMLDIV
uniref:Uncharacterized protein n=1 Tax=Acrobeloides nanus TaxID=290746 RepID=A0A914DXJ6_9BILA